MPVAETICRSLRFATVKHGDQRYGAHAYTFHLLAALSVAFEFGVTDEIVLVAIPLHDTEEDTDTTRRELTGEFGKQVESVVWRVTNEPGKNRKIRALATYPKIAESRRARLVKLCDRIANTRSCWEEAKDLDANKRNKSKLGMYRKEYGGFRKALRPLVPTGPETAMWAELDRLMAWES
jgi:guanosine-3',5'-bis(diphosphate) 3'-pyrophosphohydrolase